MSNTDRMWQNFLVALGLPIANESRPIARSQRGKDKRDWQPRDIELIRKAQQGDKRIEAQLMASYEGFIRSRVRTTVSRMGWLYDDILQEARCGFQFAMMQKFDTEAGYELTTYSAHWIRHHVDRFLDNCTRTIRVPVHTMDPIRQAARAGVTTAEDAARMFPTIRDIKAAWPLRRNPASLDAEHVQGDGSTVTLLEMTKSEALIADEVASKAELHKAIDGAMSTLDPRARLIIERRYLGRGKSASGDDTLKAIGDSIGRSRERIRQVERRALKQLGKELRKRSDVCAEM